jgi:hypothetical protein
VALDWNAWPPEQVIGSIAERVQRAARQVMSKDSVGRARMISFDKSEDELPQET